MQSDARWVSSSLPYLRARPDGSADAWSAETATQGRRGRQKIVHAGEVPAPDAVAGLLGVRPGEVVVVRRRLMVLDDRPSELTDTYYPVRIARGTPLAGTAKIRGGAVTLLARLGYVGATVREDVVARMPTDSERQALDTAPGEPVIQLTRLTLDGAGQPIQADQMIMPAHRQRLRYEITLS
ncbi:UTRA domain-containing protein [Streptomyces rectiverticillatus]|uniref:UTRA domain-containing protein n=1 Tax=Streptomyces rectiverticillatus TaxID=173860 RepID=UPI0015C40B2D|nr:UTRA domain-containing protein [Streptomyces rectiverticillatus]QLE73494.1 UTRA domain-containing protein [Streptomyces rectiverticillatus]